MGLGPRRRRQRQRHPAASIVGDLPRPPAAARRLVNAKLCAAEASTTTEYPGFYSAEAAGTAEQERRIAALAASIALGEARGVVGAAPDENSRQRTEAKKVSELPPP